VYTTITIVAMIMLVLKNIVILNVAALPTLFPAMIATCVLMIPATLKLAAQT
jgi:hypothetical protein